jgi:glycerophosphoryl diester phosphodiesterase
MTHKPLVIAHRGASREAPENTLPAFARARELGADGVELDVLPSAEGVLVVTHNEQLEILTGMKGRVGRFALSELKKLDFGSHFSPKFKGEKIPALQEVFDLLKDNFLINVEIKGINVRGDGREETLAALIRKWKLTEQVIVSSFNVFALRRMAKAAPEIRRGYLFYEKQMGPSRRGGWAPFLKPYSMHISKALIKPNTISRFHQKGYQCWIWTVNDEKEMRKLIRQRADALITDDPQKLIQVIGEGSTLSSPATRE